MASVKQALKSPPLVLLLEAMLEEERETNQKLTKISGAANADALAVAGDITVMPVSGVNGL